MLKLAVLLVMVSFATIALWSQDNETGAGTNAGNDLQMATPPPVSGESYPSTYAGAERSNYLRAGLSFNTQYTDNLLGGTNHVSDISYNIWPSISLDKRTGRMQLVFTYSPGFTVYQKTGSLDQANQNLGINFQYRLSPHVTLSLRDNLVKTSNVFNQPNPLEANPVPGSAQAPTVAVVAPTADQLNNNGGATLSYQLSPSSMVGVGGTFSNLHYINPVPGLFDSNSFGGSAFYNHRLSRRQYVGANYQYQTYRGYQATGQYNTQTHTIYLFYTVYLKPSLTISVSGGPQYAEIPQPPLPSLHSWNPAGSASIGWHARHTNIAGSYSRIVSGGGGLIGAFHSTSANASVSRQLAPRWSAGATASYSIYKDITPFSFLTTPGGHTLSGSATLQHSFNTHFNASVGYTRLHQSYGSIPLISNAPDTNNEWISLSYQVTRALGR
jgi:hypothetical protein